MWEVGVQGVKAHPQKFWFIENTDKIPENPGKIRENLSKIYEHVRKMPAILGKLHEIWIKWRPTLFDFEKLAPKVERITLRPFYLSQFWRSFQKRWNTRRKSCPKTLRASLGKSEQKSFAPPKSCLLVHDTYVLDQVTTSHVCASSTQQIMHFNWQSLNKQHSLCERWPKQSLNQAQPIMTVKFQWHRWNTNNEFKTKK